MSLIALLLALTAAQPAERPDVDHMASPEYRRCMASGDAARGVTAGMMDCLGTETDLQDRRLNRAYRAAMQRLAPGRREGLRRLQRAWIRERERTCERDAAEGGGGTASALIFGSCFLRETVLRTQWLQRRR